MIRLRPRFSLATLLLGVTMACLLAALAATSAKLRQVRAELAAAQAQLAEYRVQFGYVDISDPSKLHAACIPTTTPWLWMWRVYVPAEGRWKLRFQTNQIEPHGFSGDLGGSMPLPPGEGILYARVTRDAKRRLVFRVGQRGGSSCTYGLPDDWLRRNPGWLPEGVFARSGTVVAEPNKPLVLLRFRATREEREKDGTGRVIRAPDGPTDGVLVWITAGSGRKPRSAGGFPLAQPGFGSTITRGGKRCFGALIRPRSVNIVRVSCWPARDFRTDARVIWSAAVLCRFGWERK